MLSCSIRNRMFTSRNLKKCALVCTTRVQQSIASVTSQFFPVLCRDYFGQHRYTPYVYIFERALRWRENPTICRQSTQIIINVTFIQLLPVTVVPWIHHCIVQACTQALLILLR